MATRHGSIWSLHEYNYPFDFGHHEKAALVMASWKTRHHVDASFSILLHVEVEREIVSFEFSFK